MSRRLMLGSLVFALLLILSNFGTTAQECGDLTQEDCDRIITMQRTMLDLDSAAFGLRLNVDIGNQNGDEVQSIVLTADGTYVADLPTFSEIRTFQELLTETILAVNSDITFTLQLPEIVLPFLPVGIDDRLAFDLRLVDGVGYLDLTKIIEASDPGSPDAGWYGVNLLEFYARLFQDTLPPGLTIPPGTFPEDAPPLVTSILGTLGPLQRLDDDTYNAIPVAVYETDVNLASTLEDPLTRGLVINALALALGQQSLDRFYTEAELREAAAIYLDFVAALEINVTRHIGLEDGYLYRLGFELDFLPDEALVEGLQNGPDPLGAAILAETTVALTFSLELAQFNAAPATPAPDATLIPLEELLPAELLPDGEPA